MTCNWIQSDTDSTAGENPPNNTMDTLLETQRTDLQSSPLTFGGDYMTMELFQKVCQVEETDATVTAVIENNSDNKTVKALRLNYVRQFSTSPPSDSEHVSTSL